MTVQLYDGESSICWAHRGLLTREQMADVPQYEQLLSQPSVLFDDGAGKVYDWRLLSAECTRYGVDHTGDASADYAALLAAMERPRLTPDQELQAQFDALAGLENGNEQ